MISFIAPTYNVEKYIEKFIRSVLLQKCELELIMVDDGSTDSSGSICDEWAAKDNRIKIIHQKNSGVVSAWAKGVSICNGDYVSIVDPDDYLNPGYGEKIEKIISEYYPDSIYFGCVFESNGEIIENYDSNLLGLKEGLYIGEDTNCLKKLTFCRTKGKKNLFHNAKWKMVVKKEIALKGVENSPKDIMMGDDICFHLTSVYESDSIYLCDDKYYVYQVRDDSISTTYEIKDSAVDNINELMANIKLITQKYGYYDEDSYKYELSRQFCIISKKILKIKDKKKRRILTRKLSALPILSEFNIFADGKKLEWKSFLVMFFFKLRSKFV